MSFGDEPCPSFIDRTAQLLGEFEISGSHEAHDVAVNLLTHLSEIIGYDVVKKGEHYPDKETLIEEIYDDFNAYGDLCKSMECEEHPCVAGTLFAKAHDELRQTKTKYTMDYFKKHGHKEKRRSA